MYRKRGPQARTARFPVQCRCPLRAGATLVQLYSSLVFKGPGLIEEIKRDLVSVLERTKHKSLSEIVGPTPRRITAEPWLI